MGLFANRWRALREAASSEVASSPVQEPEPEPVRPRRAGKLRNIVLQQE
jgi:hypothetical protein